MKSFLASLSIMLFLVLSTAVNANVENPFGMSKIATSQKQLAETKCGQAKCGDSMKKAKCGDSMKKEGKCGDSMKEEGKCGDSMKKEGKCGDSMKEEGKCGDSMKKEGKCGSN